MKDGLRSNTPKYLFLVIQHFSISAITFPIFTANMEIESLKSTYLLRLQIPCLSPSGLWSLGTTKSASSGKYNYRAMEYWMFALAVTDEGCSIKQIFIATPQDMQLSNSKHQMCMFTLLTQALTIPQTHTYFPQ